MRGLGRLVMGSGILQGGVDARDGNQELQDTRL